MVNASDNDNQPKRVYLKNSKMKISFPRKPLEMSFTVSFQNKKEKGKLHIYSVPMLEKDGLLVLGILSAPHLNKEIFKEELFKKYFDSYLIKYLFYHPRQFHNKQTFNCSKTEFEGMHILSIEYTYEGETDEGETETRMIKGAAVLKEQTLYYLLYLAPKNNFDDELLKDFVGSFNI